MPLLFWSAVCLPTRPLQGRDSVFLWFPGPGAGRRVHLAQCTTRPGVGRGGRTRTAAAAASAAAEDHQDPGLAWRKGVFLLMRPPLLFGRGEFPESWVLRFHRDVTRRHMMLRRLLGGA